MSARHLAIGLVVGGLALAGTPAFADVPHSLQVWDNAARLALPAWLKAWLGLLALTFVASLYFARQHPAARWVALGFATSHLLVVVIANTELAVMRTGLVSLLHVLCWTPGAVALVRALPTAAPGSAYGVWSRLLLFIIAVAFIFDLRDAGMYLYYLATGHPVLTA